MANNYQTRTLQIWAQNKVTFNGSGVTLGTGPYMSMECNALTGELLVTTDWEESDNAKQITTEQLAFEDREVITNRYVSGRSVTIEYNMDTQANQTLDETIPIRRDCIKNLFSLSMTYKDKDGVQRVEAFKDCDLTNFTFKPNGAGNYNITMTFKVLDSRKYITPSSGPSYRAI